MSDKEKCLICTIEFDKPEMHHTTPPPSICIDCLEEQAALHFKDVVSCENPSN